MGTAVGSAMTDGAEWPCTRSGSVGERVVGEVGDRTIYTGMGHPAGARSENAFMKHIEGAIEMAAGVTPFNCDVG